MPTSHLNPLGPMAAKLAKRSPLGPADVDALLSLPWRAVTSDPGDYLVREGDRAEHCVLLLAGFAFRSKIAGSGARQILSLHVRGDLVDLQNSLLDTADHSVQALTRTDAAYIPRAAIVEVTDAHPAVRRALWRDTLVDASIFREWILNVGRRDARQRIAHLFCEFALRQQEAGLSVGPRYDWPLTQEQIGDATGLTSVHVNRTIKGMRQDGLIETGSRWLTIINWPGLQRMGDFSRAYLHQALALAA